MKHLITVLAAFFTFAATAFARNEKLAPGIYAIVDSTATHLSYTLGTAGNSGTNIFGMEMENTMFTYKGETSGVKATGKLVIDPEKKTIRQSPKVYDPFIRTMTPGLIMIIPLEVVKNKRVYDEGMSIQGINTKKKTRVEFQWELIDENTYEITADLQPGEYAVIFKAAKLGSYDFSGIYGFTVE